FAVFLFAEIDDAKLPITLAYGMRLRRALSAMEPLGTVACLWKAPAARSLRDGTAGHRGLLMEGACGALSPQWNRGAPWSLALQYWGVEKLT
ncbi:MAG: hypothetical protein LIP02_09210, partial [Bacteroidales bacterium]|nr:hypothetical protein [Bacteroidales bacterium]